MLIQLIVQYLESNKRLVIPQLGAFLVKVPGQSVVFSELLKRDDGVLRTLLQGKGLGEVEAAGEIDRFTFEIRHAIQHGESFRLEGFGTLMPGPNQTILFEYTPGTPTASVPETHEVQTPPPATAHTPVEIGPEPKVSPSAKLNPEPYVKGLRYGKPHKNTDAYTYARPARRVDRFMLIAIAAAVIAVAAIAFGYFFQSRAERAEEQIQTEQATAPGTSENTETGSGTGDAAESQSSDQS